MDGGYPGLRTILVDNASEDDSVAFTQMHFPQVEIIEAPDNLRWAGGNNLALRRLRAESWPGYTLLLNNDTVVPAGSLLRLVNALAETPEAWLVSPRICYAGDPSRVWYDGGEVSRWSGWIRHAGIRQLAGHRDLQRRFVGYATGCAFMLKPGLLEILPELDEGYHFYGEDADYSLRVVAAGGKILHEPRALVLHKVSASVGSHSPRKVWLRTRAHIRLLKSHWPARTWPVLVPAQLAFLAGHATWHLWQGRLDTAIALWQGALDELLDRAY